MSNSEPSHNLIVNYIPQKMMDTELYSMFITMGPIEKCRVMKDHKTGYSYGFGFVNYVNPEDAEKAIQRLNGTEIYNKRIKVSYARPATENIKETNLYITGLPRNYTETDLENLFNPYGKIIQSNLLRDKYTKMPRGVAFVRFETRDDAKRAIENLDGFIPEGSSEALAVKVAEEHGKQKAAYYAGWQAALHGVNPFAEKGVLHRGVGIIRGRGREVLRDGRRPVNVRGGPFNPALENSSRGRGHRGGRRGAGRANARDNPTDLITYPLRNTNGFGAIKQERLPVRYNPLGSAPGLQSFNF